MSFEIVLQHKKLGAYTTRAMRYESLRHIMVHNGLATSLKSGMKQIQLTL